ncbi:MAG: Nramp family divalent metal transporter [Chloroflexota bacterium]
MSDQRLRSERSERSQYSPPAAPPELAGTQAMQSTPNAPVAQAAPTRQIGFSRPPLPVEDLPTPEEVFKTRRVGLQELLLFILGPSVIALGISLGSGEWLLAPLNISRLGFRGIGWVIFASIILQVFYNIELARYTLATGESPIAGFGRVPPGYLLWVPLALLCFFTAFLLGGWTVSAGEALFALFSGRSYQPGEELGTVRILGLGLMVSIFLILMAGGTRLTGGSRKIERLLEAIHAIYLPYILIGLFLITLVVVPLNFWGQSLFWFVVPARPPGGSDPSTLGALAGFAALASGLNFMFIGYYRDKGYGMGSKTGFIAPLLSANQPSMPNVGVTFPENEVNAARWRRWFRYLVIDQWGIFFVGAVLGIFLPSLLVAYLTSSPSVTPAQSASMMTYAAQLLRQTYGPIVSGWMLLTGFLLLYGTQMIVLELLARNFTDAAFAVSPRLRRLARQDPRRLYFPALIGIMVLVGLFIHIQPPAQLLLISANLSNFAALLFPLALIYLNSQLPRPARLRWWSVLTLLLNMAFFGFFFINFLWTQINGTPLVVF